MDFGLGRHFRSAPEMLLEDLWALVPEMEWERLEIDPQSPLRWTCKSTRVLAADLEKQGYEVSPQKAGQIQSRSSAIA